MSLERVERRAIDVISRVSPWLAPVPTAVLTGSATVKHLHWSPVVGVISAVIIEALGLVSINTALELYAHNARVKKDDQRAPLLLVSVTIVVYFVSVVCLTIVLDTAPDLATFAPLAFPVLSLCGMALIAVRASHARRVDEMILSRQVPYHTKRWLVARERLLDEMGARSATSVARSEKHLESASAQNAQENALARSEKRLGRASSNGKRSIADLREAVSAGEIVLSAMTGKAIGQRFNVSEQTGRKWKARLLDERQAGLEVHP